MTNWNNKLQTTKHLGSLLVSRWVFVLLISCQNTVPGAETAPNSPSTAPSSPGSDNPSGPNVVAPSGLSYSSSHLTYILDAVIEQNKPTLAIGTVSSYSVRPPLPTGLSFDIASGIISGTPTATLAATEFTITAANSVGSTSAVVNIAVIYASPNTPSAPVASNLFSATTSVTFSWAAPVVPLGGTDVASYQLLVGTTPDGSDVFSGPVNGLSKTISGTNGQTYYARVLAVDSAGNRSPYSATSAGVTVDTQSPSIGLFKGSTSVTSSSYTINWEAAVDNITTPNSIAYLVCSSNNYNDISTITGCDGQSANIEMTYTVGVTSMSISGKTPESTTFYNVIAKDQAGNKALYKGLVQRTSPSSFGRLAFNGPIEAISTASDGTAYIGGFFSQVSQYTGGGAQLDLATGSLQQSPQPAIQGVVYASAPDGNGGFYIGGTFSNISSVPRNGLAHIDKYNNLDLTWNPNATAGTGQGPVSAMAVIGQTIYVGGVFTFIGGVSRNYLAAIGSDGAVLDWNPNPNASVKTFALSGSVIYIGGRFTSVSGQARKGLAAFDLNGNVTSWNPPLTTSNHNDTPYINSIVTDGTVIYVGGYFKACGGFPRNGLAAFDSSGSLKNWNPNSNGEVYALALGGSLVYIGGNFTAIGGVSHSNLAAVDYTGAVTNWQPNPNSWVNAIAVAGSNVFVGGPFQLVSGQQRAGLAGFGSDGSLLSWDPSPHGDVKTLTLADSKIYVGGTFSAIGGQQRNNLAAISSQGALLPWNPATNGEVSAINAVGANIYVGGSFTSINGQNRSAIAAIHADGSLDNWNPVIGSSRLPGGVGIVSSIVTTGTVVYFGGQFDSVNGTSRNTLAAIDTSGTLSSWNPAPNGYVVNTIALSGNTLYLGGDFTSVSGQTRNILAAVDTDGNLLSWNPSANLGAYTGHVSVLAVSGSTIYAGGAFTSVGGQSRTGLAAVSSDGTVLPWSPSLSGNAGYSSPIVRALMISGSIVYVGGFFNFVGPQNQVGWTERNSLAAIDANGNFLSWNNGLDGQSTVNALAITDNKIYVGGVLNSFGGFSRANFAAVGFDGSIK